MRDVADAIARCRLFGFIDDVGRARLTSIATLEDAPRGTRLVRPGEDPRALFVVVSGLVRVFAIAPTGKEHNLHLCGPGTTFAEVAVIDGFPAPAFAEVVEDSQLLCLAAEPFRALLRDDHDLCRQLLPGLGAWVRHLVSLLEDLVLRDAYARTARWLLTAMGEGGRITLPATRRHLASHLNLTPETLSRTLRRLEDDHGVQQDDDGIRVLRPEVLHAAAEGAFPRL
jgi:CRP/FNR family transcriptional regulator